MFLTVLLYLILAAVPDWIGWEEAFPWDVETEHSRLSARYLRTEFTLDGAVRSATLDICGLGLYECYINGGKVSEDVLTPNPTDYRKTILYNSYDVTALLSEGPNALGVALGAGRFYTMQQHYKPHKIRNFGYPKLWLRLHLVYADGTENDIVSREQGWRLTAEGPVRSANEYDGEIYDARHELGDWTRPGYDDAAWLPARRSSLPDGTLRPADSPAMRVMRTLEPVSLARHGDAWILDFGQNLSGWVRMRLHDTRAGQTVRLRFAETLNPDGSLYTANFRHAQSTDTYICSGREAGGWWHPVFTTHGFRYVEISGIREPSAEDFTAELVYDNIDSIGSFECSNEVLNTVWRNAWWGIASNYKGMPIDCPQRDERMPWLGDRVAGALGESFLFDTHALYAKWMRDIREAQREDGAIPDVAPAFWNYYSDNMTWPAALPMCCDMLWEQFGDLQPIRDSYGAIVRWMEYMYAKYADADGIITKDRYGDWCMPPESPELVHSEDPDRITDGALISTAYYVKISRLLAKFARLQGLRKEARRWDAEADRTASAFNRRFLHLPAESSRRELLRLGTLPPEGKEKRPRSAAEMPSGGRFARRPDAASRRNGSRRATAGSVSKWLQPSDSIFYGNNTVTANVLPLAFDIVPPDCREAVAQNLVAKILRDGSGHISCGVIGLQWIQHELSRMGRSDVAFLLASQDTYPSYGYMAARGATTIWELWNGDTADPSMNSGNHVMLLGDLLAWYYHELAGIRPATPGYGRIALRPDFSIEGLDWVNASYRTPHGVVESRWRKDLSTLEWDIVVPEGTRAYVYLPGRRRPLRAGPGAHHYSAALPRDRRIVESLFLYEKASFPQCHASTIAQTPEGDLVAAWFGGSYEKCPDVCIWTSRKPAGSTVWEAPQLVEDGVQPDGTPVACWNPVLFQIPGQAGDDGGQAGDDGSHAGDDKARHGRPRPAISDQAGDDKKGELLLFYKVAPTIQGWVGYLRRSSDGGRSWSEAERLPDGLLGAIKDKPVMLADGRIIAPSSTEDGVWRIHFEISDDGGRSWRKVGPVAQPEGFQCIQPSILIHPDGSLQALCRTKNGSIGTTWSRDRGESWSEVYLLDVPHNQSGLDAVTLRDGTFALVHNDVGPYPGTTKGPRTPLSVSTSRDGVHWQHRITLEDSPVGEYSYPSVIQDADGSLDITYTWRRRRVKYVKVRL